MFEEVTAAGSNLESPRGPKTHPSERPAGGKQILKLVTVNSEYIDASLVQQTPGWASQQAKLTTNFLSTGIAPSFCTNNPELSSPKNVEVLKTGSRSRAFVSTLPGLLHSVTYVGRAPATPTSKAEGQGRNQNHILQTPTLNQRARRKPDVYACCIVVQNFVLPPMGISSGMLHSLRIAASNADTFRGDLWSDKPNKRSPGEYGLAPAAEDPGWKGGTVSNLLRARSVKTSCSALGNAPQATDAARCSSSACSFVSLTPLCFLSRRMSPKYTKNPPAGLRQDGS